MKQEDPRFCCGVMVIAVFLMIVVPVLAAIGWGLAYRVFSLFR